MKQEINTYKGQGETFEDQLLDAMVQACGGSFNFTELAMKAITLKAKCEFNDIEDLKQFKTYLILVDKEKTFIK